MSTCQSCKKTNGLLLLQIRRSGARGRGASQCCAMLVAHASCARSQTQSKLNTSAQHQYIPLDVAGVRTEPCQLLVAVARYNLMHGP